MLKSLWKKYKTDKYDHNYLDFYDEIFQQLDIKSLLEIGVLKGDSLRMWREYLPGAIILGVDITWPLDIDGCVVLKTDATTEEFADMVGMFDVIIDDWGHRVSQQRKSFENLWSHVNEWGIYIIEDICCSFRPKYIDEPITMYERIISLCNADWIRYKEFWKTGTPWYDPWTLVLYK